MSTSSDQHHEIEIKLDAGADYRLPSLRDLPGVVAVADAEVNELDAVYWDSADLRLTRNRSTLRRRSGGGDEGWHLKLPVSDDERLEIRRAPGRSARAVPPALRGLVAVHLRGAAVQPVARIATRRTLYRLLGDGEVVLAEVADDVVTAQALGAELTSDSWREIEVELVDGDLTLLRAAGELLGQAGARPATVHSKVRRILGRRLHDLSGGARAGSAAATGAARFPQRSWGSNGSRRAVAAGPVAVEYLAGQLAALVQQDPRVKLSADEGVHQMRVATRRMRTALASFRPLFAQGAVEPLRAELKWLAAVLGVARDVDVMQARLHREVDEQPVELVVGPVVRRLDLELRAQRKDAHAHVLEALNGDRYFALVDALEAFVAEPPFGERAGASAKRELRRWVRKGCRRVQRACDGLDQVVDRQDRDHHLHQVRIAAKRARYAAEAVLPVHGKRAKRLAKAMEQVQETLGRHQDAAVERDWLRDLAMRAYLAGENSFTFGRLHGLTDARAELDEQAFTAVWRRTRRQIRNWPG